MYLITLVPSYFKDHINSLTLSVIRLDKQNKRKHIWDLINIQASNRSRWLYKNVYYLLLHWYCTWLHSVSDTLSVGPVEDFHFQQTDILTLNFTQVLITTLGTNTSNGVNILSYILHTFLCRNSCLCPMQAADKHPGRFLWVEFEFKCLVFGENKEHKGFFFFFFLESARCFQNSVPDGKHCL